MNLILSHTVTSGPLITTGTEYIIVFFFHFLGLLHNTVFFLVLFIMCHMRSNQEQLLIASYYRQLSANINEKLKINFMIVILIFVVNILSYDAMHDFFCTAEHRFLTCGYYSVSKPYWKHLYDTVAFLMEQKYCLIYPTYC